MASRERVLIVVLTAVFLTAGIVAGVEISKHGSGNQVLDNISRPNIIIISMDTVRKDHLGVYGYDKKPTSPNIDKFGKENLVFTQAMAQSSWTRPSLASLFTSQYVGAHEVGYNRSGLSSRFLTLTEALDSAGYNTGAFVGSTESAPTWGGDLPPKYNFDQGFDTYYAHGMYFKTTVTAAKKWLDNISKSEKPFMLYIHGYNAHDPYGKHTDYSGQFTNNYSGILSKNGFKLQLVNRRLYKKVPKAILGRIQKNDGNWVMNYNGTSYRLGQEDLAYINNSYDAGVREVDEYVGKLIFYLRMHNIYKNSIIIITSSHGETLGEHRLGNGYYFGHGHTDAYSEDINVPFLMHVPGLDHRVIDQKIELTDIFPTLMKFTESDNRTLEDNLQGKSLLPLLEGKDKTLHRYTYSRYPIVIRSDKWTYIPRTRNPDRKPELYNRIKDPNEQVNVYPEHTDVVSRLEDALKKHEFQVIKDSKELQ